MNKGMADPRDQLPDVILPSDPPESPKPQPIQERT
jgi:hypothetical protein